MFLKIEIQNELPPLQHPTIISEVLLCLIAAARYDAPLGPTGLDDALCARTADLIVHFQGDPCLRGSPCPSEMGSEEDAILESHADARNMPGYGGVCGVARDAEGPVSIQLPYLIDMHDPAPLVGGLGFLRGIKKLY